MIVLVGFMGAGKSTVGRGLAQRLGVRFVDSDLEIEQREHRTIRQIFAEDGEPAFRELEHAVVRDLLGGPDVVLSLGGGAVEDPRTRRALAGVPVVFLNVSFAEAMARVGHDPLRPVLHRPDLEGVFERRQAAYREVATLTVVTGRTSSGDLVEQILGQVLGRLSPPPAGSQRPSSGS